MGLTHEETEFFIDHGYIRLKSVIPVAFIGEWWEPRRQFLKDTDFHVGQSHLYFPRLRTFNLKDVCPTVDEAVVELMGGEDRIKAPRVWGDGFVVACPQKNDTPIDLNTKYQWHKDGFFRHFLDSNEIGLLAFVMWTNVTSQNGATALAEGSMKLVAEDLAQKTEGVNPDYFNSRIDGSWPSQSRAEGNAGDIYLVHPFLLHATRPNFSDDYRAITNPHIALEGPMKFNRPHSDDFSPVEKTVLRALGTDSLDFTALRKRELEKSNSGVTVNSIREKLREELEAYLAR